jgi:branched-chain amino acid transport system permease protein
MAHLVDMIVTGLLRGGLYALMAVGLSLVFGVMNIPNFAHGELYMLGAFFSYFCFVVFKLGPVLSIIGAALATFVIGIIIERLTLNPLRKKTKDSWLMNTFLLTLGISIILQNGVTMIWGSTFRGITAYWPGVVKIGGMDIAKDRVMGFAISMIAILVFWFFLNKTKTGRAIRAVSLDETGAKLMGIDLNKIHTLTFALSAALAAIAGASLLSITPASPMMGQVPLLKSWFVLILVGMGNVDASIWGGFILGLLETFAYFQLGAGWQDAVSLGLIILILLFKPAGLFAKKGVKTVWE